MSRTKITERIFALNSFQDRDEALSLSGNVYNLSIVYLTKYISIKRTCEDNQFVKHVHPSEYTLTLKVGDTEVSKTLPTWLGRCVFKVAPKQMHIFQLDTKPVLSDGMFKMQVERYINQRGGTVYLARVLPCGNSQVKDFKPESYSFLKTEVTGFKKFREFELFKKCKKGVLWHVNRI